MFNLFPKKKSVDELIEETKPKINIAAEWNELLKEVLQLRYLKEENVKLIECTKNLREQQNFLYQENEKLKKDIENYVFEKDDEIEKLKKENLELVERVNEIDNDVIRDLKDEIFVLKNDYAVLKAQKHPMYPIHWMGLDPLIHEQSKDLTIEQAIDKVKQKTPWVEEPVDWKGETTAENLEEKFDKGENVEPYHCPCNMCKHAREENIDNSWKDAAGDLALRVAKLEEQLKYTQKIVCPE